MEIYLSPLKEAFKISCFVILILMLMEFLHLFAPLRLSSLQKKRSYFVHLSLATALGWVPGCVGGFTSVSLFSHGFFSFGAVIATAFTALGDDVFRMFPLMPKLTIFISLGLAVLGLCVAYIVDRIPYLRQIKPDSASHLHVHTHEPACVHTKACMRWVSPAKWSFTRALLVFVTVVYLWGLFNGTLGHSHAVDVSESMAVEQSFDAECSHAGHAHSSHEACGHSAWEEIFSLENLLFIVLGLLALGVLLRVDEHFLNEHLWSHVIKKHFLSIFTWTAGTLYFLFFAQMYFPLDEILSSDLSKRLLVFAFAILIGWIPQSGPHFIFISLFSGGYIPFSVLLANSIVQDGHTSLVLLAESRKSFFLLKIIKSLVALLIGGIFMIFFDQYLSIFL